MMRIEVKACAAAEIFSDPEGDELIAQYAEECACALVGKPAPRQDVYENLEAAGMAQCFTVRNDGKLVGFACVIVSLAPHYGLSCATTESIFVTRDAHGGLELKAAIEKYAESFGCVSMFYSAVVGSRFARLMFIDTDQYVNTHHVFCKRLK